jgi:hypothetical protein
MEVGRDEYGKKEEGGVVVDDVVSMIEQNEKNGAVVIDF